MKRTMFWSLIALLALVLAVTHSAAPASAGQLPLPPRPTPVPTATPVPPIQPVTGGVIRLSVDTKLASLWTAVEWQDTTGNWHSVEGWQGTLDTSHTQTWWVGQADQGKGPFRWVVYDRRGGQALATSAAFNLPTINRQVVDVSVTLP